MKIGARNRLKDRIVDVTEGASPRHTGISRPVRQQRDRKVGHPDQGQRGDRGLTASSIESVALPGLSQLDFAVDLVGEADAAERHRRAGGEGLIAFEPALHKGLADRLFDLALGGHAERLEKLPNAGVEDVFVHGHLRCTCPSRHDSPVLACPVVYHLRPPSQPLPAWPLAGGRSPLLALRSRPTIQIVASACRRRRSSTYRIRVTKRPPVPSETGAIWPQLGERAR